MNRPPLGEFDPHGDTLPPGMKVLVLSVRRGRQEAWQLVVKECFEHGGCILLRRRSKGLLKPQRVKDLFPGNLVPCDVQELRDFPSEGGLDRPGFFLLSASCAIAVCSITAHNSLKMA